MMWTLQCQQVAPKWFSRCSMVIPKKSLWSPSDVQVVSKGSPQDPPENHQMVPNIQVRYQFCILFSSFLGGREGGSAQPVGFFNIGSGRVLDKIPGSGSGSGRVGVSKNTIGYFRVSFFLSGISGYFGYFRVCRVFSGISGFTHIY